MFKQIPLSELKHSPNNVRKVKPSDQGFKSLCASISSKGLLHNLVVAKNGKGYEVVDGNRRLDALTSVYASDNPKINCIVIDKDDAEIGLHANMMREDMHPLDECDVIMALCHDGSEDLDSVAVRFGQTTKWVKQRISLSELSDKAKAMFRDGMFNMSTAQALTLGSHDKQDDYLDNNEHNLNAASAKRAMTSAKIPTTAALFTVDMHRDTLGIEADLFGDEEFITNREEFDRLQKSYIDNVVQGFRDEGYYDVVYLEDQYYWDSPELRGFQRCHNPEEYDVSRLIMVVTYNSFGYKIDTALMVHYETKEEEEAKKDQEKELTPMDYSTPQSALVDSYFAHHVLNEMLTTDKIDMVRFFKAMLCHRKLGWSGHHVHRVGQIYADPQTIFTENPDDYTPLPNEAVIKRHKDIALELDGTTPLMYCYTLSDEELDELFVACCAEGLSRSDFQAEAMQDFINDINPTDWFKPDESWVNKWKVPQLEQMEQWLYGGAKGGSKRDRVKKVTESLSTGKFNPYGSWPQNPSEQS